MVRARREPTAPLIPVHRAWMPQPCCSGDMAGTSTLYPAEPDRDHQSREHPGTQEHQKVRPRPASPIHERHQPSGIELSQYPRGTERCCGPESRMRFRRPAGHFGQLRDLAGGELGRCRACPPSTLSRRALILFLNVVSSVRLWIAGLLAPDRARPGLADRAACSPPG